MVTVSSLVVALLFASIQQPPATVTPYEFLDATIRSLGRAHAAVKAVNDTANDPSLVERMTAIQNGNIERITPDSNGFRRVKYEVQLIYHDQQGRVTNVENYSAYDLLPVQ